MISNFPLPVFAWLPVYSSVCLAVCPSICMSLKVRTKVYRFEKNIQTDDNFAKYIWCFTICLFVCLSICLSVFLFFCLSVSLLKAIQAFLYRPFTYFGHTQVARLLSCNVLKSSPKSGIKGVSWPFRRFDAPFCSTCNNEKMLNIERVRIGRKYLS